MLRTKCTWCCKTVRGGDDWSGRSGKCPNCGAEIIFPRIGPAPTGPAPAKPLEFLDAEDAWHANGWAAVVACALMGVSAWIWVRLIILLAYGRAAYIFKVQVVAYNRWHGAELNNGEHLDLFWNAIFAAGFVTTWAVLMKGVNYLVVRVERKGWAIISTILIGLMTWYSVIWQVTHQPYKRGHYETSTGRQVVMLAIAMLLVGGLTVLRYWTPKKTSQANTNPEQAE